MKTEFLTIENRKGKLKLNDGVFKESADKLIEELETLYGPAAVAANLTIGEIVCADSDALETVTVEINSPGGSVFEGQRIYNALRGMSDRGVQIHTHVDAIAASMGSVILMAGDVRTMAENARIMIHEASSAVWGDARAMKRTSDLLEGISNDIASTYAKRSGYDKDKIRQLMLAETWMDESQAFELGFITEKSAENSGVDNLTESDRNTGMSIFASIFKSAKAEEITEAQAKYDALQADYEAAAADVERITGELATANETIGDHLATITARDEKITELKNRLDEIDGEIITKDAEIANLTDAVEAAKNSAGDQAITMLAGVGQPAPLPEQNESSKTDAEILAEFRALKTLNEKHQFAQDHRDAIMRAEKAEKSN
jgi:ATP-dependent protease ClpP protease subunit/predicted  nucleic acid-binding Zn-ribbon protein